MSCTTTLLSDQFLGCLITKIVQMTNCHLLCFCLFWRITVELKLNRVRKLSWLHFKTVKLHPDFDEVLYSLWMEASPLLPFIIGSVNITITIICVIHMYWRIKIHLKLKQINIQSLVFQTILKFQRLPNPLRNQKKEKERGP